MTANDPLVLAVPKGRILAELKPLLARVGIEPEPGFADEADRRLRYATNLPGVEIISVRSFDVATFVAFGAAHLGVAGNADAPHAPRKVGELLTPEVDRFQADVAALPPAPIAGPGAATKQARRAP